MAAPATSAGPTGPEMASTSSTAPVLAHIDPSSGSGSGSNHAGPSSGPADGLEVGPPSPVSASASASGTGVEGQGGKKDEGAITPPIPKCHLRTLIISGQSHVFSFEPELTVGRVKELIWSSWPSEWTSPSAPPSPAFLRVLYSGRILQDDSTLASNSIPATLQPTNPAVVHISVRSFSLHGDEDPKKNGLVPTLSRRSSRRRTVAPQDDVGGCKCVIM